MRPLVAHCHVGLGKLYRHMGKPQPAREHLAAGTSMYREMGMRLWLEKAETELRERGTQGGPASVRIGPRRVGRRSKGRS